MLGESKVTRAFCAHAFEKRHRFGRGLEGAERFRFQAEVQPPIGPAARAFDVFHAPPEVEPCQGESAIVEAEFLEGDGHRADASLDALRNEFGKEIEEEVGIVEALGMGHIFVAGALHPAGIVDEGFGRALCSESRMRIPAGIEDDEHDADFVFVGDVEELIHALEESFRVLLPD